MSVNDLTISGIATEYLASLNARERVDQQQEVMRFVRWYGSDQPLGGLGMRALEGYLAEVEASGADSSRRLTPLRGFLSYAEDQGYLTEKLSKIVRVKRSTKNNRKQSQPEPVEREIIQLTPEGHAQLKEELDHLVNDMRPQVAEALLEARRDKDIRENAPYDAAKQQQGYMEARIRELEHILAVAEVIDDTQTRSSGGRVGIGTTVLLRDLTYDEDVRYTLVSSSEARPSEGKLSVASPVGRALLDNAEGDVVEVEAPAGKLRYRIEKVEG